MENVEHEKHVIVSDKTFILVWVALIILTIVTVTFAKMHIGSASILLPLFIASTKASLVLWFFMHLKYEKKLFRYMLLVPIITVAVILGLTFVDIWYR